MINTDKALGCIMGAVIGNALGEVFSDKHHGEISVKNVESAMAMEIG